MVVKVGAACLQLSHPLVPYSPPFSPLPSPRRWRTGASVAAASHLLCFTDRCPFFGSCAARLLRSTSVRERGGGNKTQILRRVISAAAASSDGFFSRDGEEEDEFVRKLQDLAMRFQEEETDVESTSWGRKMASFPSSSSSSPSQTPNSPKKLVSSVDIAPPPWLGTAHPDWPGTAIPSSSCSGTPLPLRATSRGKIKGGLEEGLKDVGNSACCSVKRAFSSMVFIIRELHSYTLQLRGLFCYEVDLQDVLEQVQREMHASFCWLFQQIFSCTPTLMLSLMLLLANFTVHSMAAHHSAALAALPPQPTHASSSVMEQGTHQGERPRFHATSVKSFTVGKTASVGGGGGGGKKARPVAGATGDGRFPSEQLQAHRFVPGGEMSMSTSSPAVGSEGRKGGSGAEEEPSVVVALEEEARAWMRVLEEVGRMRAAAGRHEALADRRTVRRLVAPVSVEVEADKGYPEYFRTELVYQRAVEEEPDNPLLLANYAQFLFLVVRDHDRAEHYFKRAIEQTPADPESLSRYANFLWLARKDICAAEETYLEAIEADPGNSSHAANYAHFLWSTGGEDTCFPLDTAEDA